MDYNNGGMGSRSGGAVWVEGGKFDIHPADKNAVEKFCSQSKNKHPVMATALLGQGFRNPLEAEGVCANLYGG